MAAEGHNSLDGAFWPITCSKNVNDLLIDRVLERHHQSTENRLSTTHLTPGASA